MKPETLDRRVRRTRKLLRECLIALLKTKKVQDITVRELTERADLTEEHFISTIKMSLIYWKKLRKIFKRTLTVF